MDSNDLQKKINLMECAPPTGAAKLKYHLEDDRINGLVLDGGGRSHSSQVID